MPVHHGIVARRKLELTKQPTLKTPQTSIAPAERRRRQEMNMINSELNSIVSQLHTFTVCVYFRETQWQVVLTNVSKQSGKPVPRRLWRQYCQLIDSSGPAVTGTTRVLRSEATKLAPGTAAFRSHENGNLLEDLHSAVPRQRHVVKHVCDLS